MTTDDSAWRTQLREAAARGDLDNAIRSLAESALTPGQLVTMIMEKRRELAGGADRGPETGAVKIL